MNIEHLKLFVRIASTHNISSAGKELGLSPAVASAHISKLENGLSVRLIHRTTRQVSLTEEGQAFLPHAENVLASIGIAKAAIGSGSVSPQGTLRVTAPASFGRMHMVPAFEGFLSKYPDLKVDIKLSDSIIDMVEGGFDIAIRDASLNDSTLIARKLASDKRIICASPDYLKKYGEPKTPQDLLKHQCTNFMGLENWQFETSTGRETIKTVNNFRGDNGEAVRDACINGIGITMSSIWCSYKHLRTGELVQILKDYPLVSSTDIWAVYPSSRLVAPKVRAFINYFSDYFGEAPYWEKYND
jgi:DNA-binding transcriptional LysR family regulator